MTILIITNLKPWVLFTSIGHLEGFSCMDAMGKIVHIKAVKEFVHQLYKVCCPLDRAVSSKYESVRDRLTQHLFKIIHTKFRLMI